MFVGRPSAFPVAYSDYEALVELRGKVSDPKVLEILNVELDTIRSGFVAQLLSNPVSDSEIASSASTGSGVSESAASAGTDPAPEPPPSSTSFLREQSLLYFSKGIRDFMSKLQSLHEWFPTKKRLELTTALILAKGQMSRAQEALVLETSSDSKPRFESLPSVPDDLKIQWEEERQEMVKKYDEDMRIWMESHQQAEDELSSEPLPEPSSVSDAAAPLPVIPNLDASLRSVTEEEVRTRIRLLEKEVMSMERILQLDDALDEDDERIRPLLLDHGISDDSLVVIGEKEMIIRDQPHVFTFKKTRTFANEMNSVHFGVAESQFYRMTKMGCYEVTSVGYIVTPRLLRRFESRRREFATHSRNSSKQYLFFSPLQSGETVEWVRLHGCQPDTFARGRIFSGREGYCSQYVQNLSSGTTEDEEYSFILFLVATGRERNQRVANSTSFRKPRGCDSLMDNKDKDQCVVFEATCVLPYYIVNFKKHSQNTGGMAQSEHLDAEFEEMKAEAVTDRLQLGIQEHYRVGLRNTKLKSSAARWVKQRGLNTEIGCLEDDVSTDDFEFEDAGESDDGDDGFGTDTDTDEFGEIEIDGEIDSDLLGELGGEEDEEEGEVDLDDIELEEEGDGGDGDGSDIDLPEDEELEEGIDSDSDSDS